MRRVAVLFLGALMVAGVAGAQGLPSWCDETPCARILDPVDDSTVNPETSFLVEVILSAEYYTGADCDVDLLAVPDTSDLDHHSWLLFQHQRPRGDSPIFYRVEGTFDDVAPVIFVSKPEADEGDYLPHRFRILGTLDLPPNDHVEFNVWVNGYGCGTGYLVAQTIEFLTSD